MVQLILGFLRFSRFKPANLVLFISKTLGKQTPALAASQLGVPTSPCSWLGTRGGREGGSEDCHQVWLTEARDPCTDLSPTRPQPALPLRPLLLRAFAVPGEQHTQAGRGESELGREQCRTRTEEVQNTRGPVACTCLALCPQAATAS